MIVFFCSVSGQAKVLKWTKKRKKQLAALEKEAAEETLAAKRPRKQKEELGLRRPSYIVIDDADEQVEA
jgi:hypothetical protein